MLAREIATRLYEGKVPQAQPIELHSIQASSIEKLKSHPKQILGLPMGTGKTYIGVQSLANWQPRRSLIVATDRAILSWLKTMWVWFPEQLDRYLVIGKMYKKETRQQFLERNKKHPDLSVLTNFQLITRDRDFYPTEWDSVITDEYHKFMRNRDTGMHKLMKKLKYEYLLMVSGSPSSRGAQDFFVPLNLIDPKLFSSYWRFVATWCNINETMFGKEVYGTRNEEQFAKLLTEYAILATKKQLGMQKKVRDIVPVEMTPEQERAYASMRDEFLLELEGQPAEIALNTLSQYTKLRKLLSCPAIIAPELGVGGGTKFIAETLLDLPQEERHSVIFTPYRDTLPILKAYFEGEGYSVGLNEPGVDIGVPVFIFQGGMGIEMLFETLHQFKTRGGLAICTVDFAESFDMETCDKAFMLGYSWDPQVNYQAEDRLDRLNNMHGLINIYYLQHANTLDEEILYTLAMKQTNVNKAYSNRAALAAALRAH
jgi:SNF2 family DNA or RNA helicase